MEDIPELLESMRVNLNRQFGTRVDGVTQEVEEKLKTYSWPGNVRELGNVLERAMNKQMNGVLGWNCFEEYFETKKERSLLSKTTLIDSRDTTEKQIILACLEKTDTTKQRQPESWESPGFFCIRKWQSINYNEHV